MRTAAIIISAKDAAAWLPQCLGSVAGQRLPAGWRMRILVGIDSCVTTLLCADAMKLPNVRVRFFPDHVGPFVIFNSLASLEKSDVLVRFDADDVMLHGYLWSQLALLDPELPPTISQTWSFYVDDQLRPLAALLADGSVTHADGRRWSASDGQFLMTRAAWDRLGGFRSWWCHADTEFLVRAKWSGIGRKVVSDHLYLRRVHAGSITRSNKTGYDSLLRRRYARQITEGEQRYSRGFPPERLEPTVARSLSRGIVIAGRHVVGAS